MVGKIGEFGDLIKNNFNSQKKNHKAKLAVSGIDKEIQKNTIVLVQARNLFSA